MNLIYIVPDVNDISSPLSKVLTTVYVFHVLQIHVHVDFLKMYM